MFFLFWAKSPTAAEFAVAGAYYLPDLLGRKLQKKKISQMTGKVLLKYIYKAIDLTLDQTIDAFVNVDGPVPPDSVFIKARGCKYDIHLFDWFNA